MVGKANLHCSYKPPAVVDSIDSVILQSFGDVVYVTTEFQRGALALIIQHVSLSHRRKDNIHGNFCPKLNYLPFSPSKLAHNITSTENPIPLSLAKYKNRFNVFTNLNIFHYILG